MSRSITVIPTRSEHTITFKVDEALLPYGKSLPFSEPETAELHPMAQALMAIPGVNSAWIMGDEIMVTKDTHIRWATVKPKLLETIKKIQAG
ncbi:MAG: hypothetical protein COW89_08620 [Nitrospinae bacterium CG22_combo_CG10-13_8_21_14_all_47_10]|nr:MAG: hypothetical protein COW89_08620 [Nitrospinae bacterium CG22_combo_CG10-13_8_21_14_all_47_10]